MFYYLWVTFSKGILEGDGYRMQYEEQQLPRSCGCGVWQNHFAQTSGHDNPRASNKKWKASLFEVVFFFFSIDTF